MNNQGEIFLYERTVKSSPEINIWLAFPAIRNFGLSSLGYMSIFKTLDSRSDYYVERIFTDTKSAELPLNKVDLMGFSFSFEIDFLGIFKIMETFNIPFYFSLINSFIHIHVACKYYECRTNNERHK